MRTLKIFFSLVVAILAVLASIVRGVLSVLSIISLIAFLTYLVHNKCVQRDVVKASCHIYSWAKELPPENAGVCVKKYTKKLEEATNENKM